MSRLSDLQSARRARILAVGPYPPWWRPLARRAWRKRLHAAMVVTAEEMSAIIQDAYAQALDSLARQPNPALSFGRREVN